VALVRSTAPKGDPLVVHRVVDYLGTRMTDDQKASEAREGLKDAILGKAKEFAGAVSGNDSLTAEGQLQQTEATNRRDAATRQSLADAQKAEAEQREAAERHEAEAEREQARRDATQLSAKVQQERAQQKSAADVEAERQRIAEQAVVEAETRGEVREVTSETRSALQQAERDEQQAEREHQQHLADADDQKQTAQQLRAEAARLGNPIG
jgi:uncharacterized protein YjbJ (UPF0337 family)